MVGLSNGSFDVIFLRDNRDASQIEFGCDILYGFECALTVIVERDGFGRHILFEQGIVHGFDFVVAFGRCVVAATRNDAVDAPRVIESGRGMATSKEIVIVADRRNGQKETDAVVRYTVRVVKDSASRRQ